MPRPEGREDPRAPGAEARVDSGFEDEDRARSNKTIGELLNETATAPSPVATEPIDFDAIIARIGRRRWRQLRRRRDKLIAQLRREGFGGGEQ